MATVFYVLYVAMYGYTLYKFCQLCPFAHMGDALSASKDRLPIDIRMRNRRVCLINFMGISTDKGQIDIDNCGKVLNSARFRLLSSQNYFLCPVTVLVDSGKQLVPFGLLICRRHLRSFLTCIRVFPIWKMKKAINCISLKSTLN